MFEITKFKEHQEGVVLEVEYSIPVDGDIIKREQIFGCKADAIRQFASCCATMLMLRLEEFKNILTKDVMPHYYDNSKVPYLGHQTKLPTCYWKLLDLWKDLNSMYSNPYGQAVLILKNFHLVEYCVPDLHQLGHQKLLLITADIKGSAKKLKESIEKLSNHLNKSI